MSLIGKLGRLALPLLGTAALGATPAHAVDTAGLVWMISSKALGMIATQPGGPALIEAFFDNPRTYVMAPADQLAQVPRKAVAIVNFPSFAAMRAAFGARKVDARYGAVLYDCEAWDYTPAEEQRNPVYYHRLAAQLAHDFRLQFIAAPATTLRKVLLQPTGPGVYPPFMKTGIVGPIAAVSDVFEIQAQGLLPQPDKYRALVENAAASVTAANRKVVFLAGLSTGPSGREVTAEQLYRAVAATRPSVAGYWLNIPEKSGHCEACGSARPDIAIQLLLLLQRGGGG